MMIETPTTITNAAIVSESDVFDQPEISPTLIAEREKVGRMCFNDAKVSPESLIRRALEGDIDLLDLYSYHELNLNPTVERYLGENPKGKVVNVGLEFSGEGHQGRGFGFEKSGEIANPNLYYINYDALFFCKRVDENSVGEINIDFIFDREGAGQEILSEVFRILKPKGRVSFYADRRRVIEEIVRKINLLKFSDISIDEDMSGDSFKNRYFPSSGKKIVRVCAVK